MINIYWHTHDVWFSHEILEQWHNLLLKECKHQVITRLSFDSSRGPPVPPSLSHMSHLSILWFRWFLCSCVNVKVVGLDVVRRFVRFPERLIWWWVWSQRATQFTSRKKTRHTRLQTHTVPFSDRLHVAFLFSMIQDHPLTFPPFPLRKWTVPGECNMQFWPEASWQVTSELL